MTALLTFLLNQGNNLVFDDTLGQWYLKHVIKAFALRVFKDFRSHNAACTADDHWTGKQIALLVAIHGRQGLGIAARIMV